MLKNNKFNFTGEGAQYFGILISNAFLCVFTLGIYIPWAIVKEAKYLMGNTTFSNKPFSYTGDGADILKGFLIAVFALMILGLLIFKLPTIGLLLFTVAILGGLPFSIHSGLMYDTSHTHWNEKTFEYTGILLDFIKLFLVNTLLTVVTLGIYSSWARVAIMKYIMQHLKLGRLTFDFEGEGMTLFLIMLKGIFLSIITVGIYAFWFVKDLNVYNTNNLVVYQDGRKCNFNSDLKVGDVFSMLFIGMLIIIFTLGIGTAWVTMRNMKIMLSAIDISDELDPENIG